MSDIHIRKMKKLIMLMLTLISLTFCEAGGNKPQHEAKEEPAASETGVRVLYFHGKQRCVTCRSIEQCANEVVGELGNNHVSMRVIDISDPDNESIVKEYKVSWSSLFLAKGDKRVDLTKPGFRYAKNDPAEFKRLLKVEIENMLR